MRQIGVSGGNTRGRNRGHHDNNANLIKRLPTYSFTKRGGIKAAASKASSI